MLTPPGADYYHSNVTTANMQHNTSCYPLQLVLTSQLGQHIEHQTLFFVKRRNQKAWQHAVCSSPVELRGLVQLVQSDVNVGDGEPNRNAARPKVASFPEPPQRVLL